MRYRKIYEHRAIAALKIGRFLRPGEVVHHRDGDPTNNDPDNLEICSSPFVHAQHHKIRSRKLERLERIGDLWL